MSNRVTSADSLPPQGAWFFLFWFWDDQLAAVLAGKSTRRLGERPDDLDDWSAERQGDLYAFRDGAGRIRFRLPAWLVHEGYRGLTASKAYSDKVLQDLGGAHRRAIDEVLSGPFWMEAQRRRLSHLYFALASRAVTNPTFRADVEDLILDYEKINRNLLDIGNEVAEIIDVVQLAEKVRADRPAELGRKRWAWAVTSLLADDSPMSPETRVTIKRDWDRALTRYATWDKWYAKRLKSLERHYRGKFFTKRDAGRKQARPVVNQLLRVLMPYLLEGQRGSGGRVTSNQAAGIAARTLSLLAEGWGIERTGRWVVTRYTRHATSKRTKS